MSIITTSTIAELLIELAYIGVEVSAKDDRISLIPASRLSADCLSFISACKPELMALLQDPRQRWQDQARELLKNLPAEDREYLLEAFIEREAIAAVHGELDDHLAGQVAYKFLLAHIQDKHRNHSRSYYISIYSRSSL